MIALSSAGLAFGRRNTISMTRPPSQMLIEAMCTMSEATVTIGTFEALGCPDTDQVPTPIAPSTASSTRSAPQPLPRRIGRNSTGGAEHPEPDQVSRPVLAGQHLLNVTAPEVE